MVLAGSVPEGFRERFGRATLSLELDGERVIRRQPVAEFMAESADLAAGRPMDMRARCLFLATQMNEKGEAELDPVGYFLPVGTRIVVEINGIPPMPEGAKATVVGVGAHYSPGDCGKPKMPAGGLRAAVLDPSSKK